MFGEMPPSKPFNPYAPPASFGLPPPEFPSGEVAPNGEPTDQELRLFVGRKAEIYLGKWAAMRRGLPRSPGPNWPALFLGFLFLAYRRMYRRCAYVLAFLLAETAIEEFLFVFLFGRTEPPAAVGNLVALALGVYICAHTNLWYFQLAEEKIHTLRQLYGHGPAFSAALARAGGTSFGAALLALAAFGVSIAVLILIETGLLSLAGRT